MYVYVYVQVTVTGLLERCVFHLCVLCVHPTLMAAAAEVSAGSRQNEAFQILLEILRAVMVCV